MPTDTQINLSLMEQTCNMIQTKLIEVADQQGFDLNKNLCGTKQLDASFKDGQCIISCQSIATKS